MNDKHPMQWVESGGGLLLLLAEDLLGFWEGTRPPARFRDVDASFRWNDQSRATDYDRACDVGEYMGLINVGPGQGLVLGNEPLLTTWIASATGVGGLLVRWIAAENEEAVRAATEKLPSDLTWKGENTFRVEDSPMLLFDSAFPGDDLPEVQLRISIPPGIYRVESATFEPDEATSLLLHRVRRSS